MDQSYKSKIAASSLVMWQQLNLTDRVYEEVLSLVVSVTRPDGSSEVLSEIFVAPTTIVRAFAEFLCQRSDNEAFAVKKSRVRFVDVTVSCGDTNKAVHAYRCFQHYNMPLGNYEICDELIKDSDLGGLMSSGSDSSDTDHSDDIQECHLDRHDDLTWVGDENFQRFKCWYKQTRAVP